jgi:hypothetical protein
MAGRLVAPLLDAHRPPCRVRALHRRPAPMLEADLVEGRDVE